MSDCFISYRRLPSASLAIAIQSKLESLHHIDAYVDTTRTDGSRVQFPQRLMYAIDEAPVFICLLGERDGQHTLESKWVLKEIQRAYEQRKFCIPVFQESYRPLSDVVPSVEYLLNFDGVHVLDQKAIMFDESVRQLADLIRPHRKQRRPPILLFMSLFMVVIGIALILSSLSSADDRSVAATEHANNTAVAEAYANQTALVASDTPTTLTTITPTQILIDSITPVDASVTPILQDRANLTLTAEALAANETQIVQAIHTQNAVETLVYLSLATFETWTPTVTSTATSTSTVTPASTATNTSTATPTTTPNETETQAVVLEIANASATVAQAAVNASATAIPEIEDFFATETATFAHPTVTLNPEVVSSTPSTTPTPRPTPVPTLSLEEILFRAQEDGIVLGQEAELYTILGSDTVGEIRVLETLFAGTIVRILTDEQRFIEEFPQDALRRVEVTLEDGTTQIGWLTESSLQNSESLAVHLTITQRSGSAMRTTDHPDAPLVRSVPEGTMLEILSRSEDGWYEVEYDGHTGWVSGDVVAVTGNIDNVPFGTPPRYISPTPTARVTP